MPGEPAGHWPGQTHNATHATHEIFATVSSLESSLVSEQIQALPFKDSGAGLDCVSDIVEYNTSLEGFRFFVRALIITTKTTVTGVGAWSVRRKGLF